MTGFLEQNKKILSIWRLYISGKVYTDVWKKIWKKEFVEGITGSPHFYCIDHIKILLTEILLCNII